MRNAAKHRSPESPKALRPRQSVVNDVLTDRAAVRLSAPTALISLPSNLENEHIQLEPFDSREMLQCVVGNEGTADGLQALVRQSVVADPGRISEEQQDDKHTIAS